ncbi:MAG: hypothetical protein COT85_02730 [Chlamydiae bacterium CG10_big_fil_rev_8_21_14_0_10_42_34]|nr:MAG: hypothetical protein COT85_02730 [Chlamydiae bacterium CG10_big_fil_rev_8_21_14_0_10_42_34]
MRAISPNMILASVAIHAGIYAGSTTIIANPIGIAGGAVFGAVAGATDRLISYTLEGSQNKVRAIALKFFAKYVLAGAAVATLGFPASLANVVLLSLAGNGCSIACYHFTCSFASLFSYLSGK